MAIFKRPSKWLNMRRIFHIKAGLYDKLRQNGHTLKESLDAVQFIYYPNKEVSNESLSIYSEHEILLIAEATAKYFSQDYANDIYENDFVKNFVKLYMDTLSAKRRITVNSLKDEFIDAFAKDHPDWEKKQKELERIRTLLNNQWTSLPLP